MVLVLMLASAPRGRAASLSSSGSALEQVLAGLSKPGGSILPICAGHRRVNCAGGSLPRRDVPWEMYKDRITAQLARLLRRVT